MSVLLELLFLARAAGGLGIPCSLSLLAPSLAASRQR